MKTILLATSILIPTCSLALAGEWRLSGEVRYGSNDWVQIESQSDSANTLVATEDRDLLPGNRAPLVPEPATVGGVAKGSDWTYYFALEGLHVDITWGRFQYQVRGYVSGQQSVSQSQYEDDMVADSTNHDYWVEREIETTDPSSNKTVQVHFRIERSVPAPEFIITKDAYGPTSFHLNFLPVPFVGKVLLQAKYKDYDWATFSVRPTWFEHDNSVDSFGPLNVSWLGRPGLYSSLLFRMYQVPFDPVVHSNVTQQIDVPGVEPYMEYLSFGDDCNEVIVRARWSVPAGTGNIKMGFTNTVQSVGITRVMGPAPFVYTLTYRCGDGTNWTIFARRP